MSVAIIAIFSCFIRLGYGFPFVALIKLEINMALGAILGCLVIFSRFVRRIALIAIWDIVTIRDIVTFFRFVANIGVIASLCFMIVFRFIASHTAVVVRLCVVASRYLIRFCHVIAIIRIHIKMGDLCIRRCVHLNLFINTEINVKDFTASIADISLFSLTINTHNTIIPTDLVIVFFPNLENFSAIKAHKWLPHLYC